MSSSQQRLLFRRLHILDYAFESCLALSTMHFAMSNDAYTRALPEAFAGRALRFQFFARSMTTNNLLRVPLLHRQTTTKMLPAPCQLRLMQQAAPLKMVSIHQDMGMNPCHLVTLHL